MISGKYIDLHVHTNYSDGFDSIKEVLRKAKENNVGYISLVEHYNVSSYNEACQLAGDDIVVIPGIELGADMSKYFVPGQKNKHICHLLGYYISKDICKLLDKYELDRYECVTNTISLLNSQGIEIDLADVIANARDKKSIGRFDIALTLKALGYSKTATEAYGKYLDHNDKSYVQRKKLEPEDLVRAIRKYGGVPVLAHPKSLRLPKEELDVFIEKLVKAGLCGIEVYNPNNSEAKRKELLEYCEKYDLIPTCGSDYHGGNRKPKIEIGRGIKDNLLIDDKSIIEGLERKRKEI
jgi:predicted metal-dependent phosphoesterase TrpH